MKTFRAIKRRCSVLLRLTLGRILARENSSGHTMLCRIIEALAHYGPHGTFVLLDSRPLKAGGYLCSFGVQCGKPTDSYMRQHFERVAEFERIGNMLKAAGALHTMIWQHPRFSAQGLCQCGRSEDPEFAGHDPLCPYRLEHQYPVSVDEYRAAIQTRIQ